VSAFCLIEPAERFSVRAIDATGVFFFECPLSAVTSPLVQARRLVRDFFEIDLLTDLEGHPFIGLYPYLSINLAR
jgi:hypothetical protein